ncbi:MAG: nucleoside-triphosphatase [Oscillospiraceae bacterium]|nr:nucleoside-triphosphatase [Oscillospiraceae bacterium]
MKLLLTGLPGAGKSTIVRAMLSASGRDPRGFYTAKGAPAEDGSVPVFLHPASGEGEPRLVGRVYPDRAEGCPEAFNASAALLEGIPEGSLVVMDELGFMENRAEVFKARVLAVLAGDYDIIAVIKPRSTPFLDAVRAVGGVELVGIDETDREALRRELVGRAEKELRR